MTDSALIDTSVTLVKTYWAKDCDGEWFPLHQERDTHRALAWDPMEVTYSDLCHLLALSIANAEASHIAA